MKRLAIAIILKVCCCTFLLETAQGQEEQRSQQTRFQQGLRDTIHLRALLNRAQSLELINPDSAIQLNKQVLDASTTQGYNFGTAGALYQMGKIYTYHGEHDSAFTYFQKAFRNLTDQHTIQRFMPALYASLGHLYEKKGDFEIAADMHMRAALIAERLANDAERHYSNLALVLMRLKRYDQALYYLNLAESKINNATDPEVKGAILVNKGIMYNKKNELLHAQMYLLLSLEHARIHQIHSIQHIALLNLSEILIQNKKPETALPLLKKIYRLERVVAPAYHNATLRKLGETYTLLGMYDSADYYLNKAMSLAAQQKIAVGLLECYLLLAQRYKHTHDYQDAYNYLDKYLQLQDSLIDLESGSSLNRLEVKYRTAQKEKENAEHKLIISQQRERLIRTRLLLGGTAILLLISSVALLIVYQFHRKLQNEKIRRIQQQQKASILQAIMQGEEKERKRLARELHDGIGGMLASVKMHLAGISKQHPHTNLSNAIEMLDETAHEVRKTSHNLMPEILFRHGLEQATRIFCNNLRKTRGLDIEFQCIGTPAPLDRDLELFLYRTIQELVQNVIKHAAATHLLVQLSMHSRHLSILVEDNGVGIDPHARKNGTGLDNLSTRIRWMNGQFHVDSSPNVGTTVFIEFDLDNINLVPDE